MRSRIIPLAAFAALLCLVAFTGSRASADPPVAMNASELGRVFAAHFPDPQNGWALADLVAEVPRINVVRTTDGGNTWQILWTFTREADLEGIWMTSVQRGVISSANKYFRTRNGGRRWGRVRSRYEMSKLSFTGDRGFAIGMPPVKHGNEGPTLLRSKNSGSTWTAVIDQPATVIDYCFSTGERGWIVDDRGMSLTTDGGGSWALKKEVEELTAVACHGERYVWAVGGGKVHRSFDHTRTWFENDLGTSTVITHLVFLNGSDGWAYGERELRRTRDGGRTWQVLNAPPGVPHFFDTEKGWALGPNGNIFRTRNGGRTWSRQERATNARTDTAVDLGEAGGALP